MPDTVTPNLGLTSPQVNASLNTWGGKLDNNNSILDGLFVGPPTSPALKVANGGTGATTAAGALSNLGCGNSATKNVGTTSGTVAAGDDSRITNSVQQGGSASLTSLTTQSWTVTSSDRALKDNIQPLPEGLTYKLKPVRYTLKSTMRESWGFIWQDVAEDPDLSVLGVHDGTYGGIQYPMIIAALVRDLQALRAKFDKLEAQVKAKK